MTNIQTLLESSNPYRVLQDEAKRLVKKWGTSGLLEKLNENEKGQMAMLLENQAKQLVLETNQTSFGTNNGATFTAGTGENWAGVALPLVRRVFADIAAKEFVSVQTMNLPSGLIFYLDFKYGTNKKDFNNQSVYGISQTNYKLTDTGSGLYGVGRFGYSINQFSASAIGVTSSVSIADVNWDSTLAAVTGSLTKVLVPIGSFINVLDADAVRAMYVSGSTIDETKVLTAFTTVTGTTASFIVSGAPATSASYTVFYNISDKDNARGDFEADRQNISVPNANSQYNIVIPELDVNMISEAVVAKTRKLKAQWTPEFTQDLQAYQSIDAEAELTGLMSQYISMEIDLEILEMLLENVQSSTTDYWSAVNNNQWNGNGFTQVSATTGGFYNTQGGWFQTLGTKLQKVSNKIHQLTLRGGANFMVVSPTISTIIESIPGFASGDADGEKMEYNFGVQKIGSLNSRYKVYKNPYFTENVILLGYKGSQFLETGAVYAPYVPIIMTPLVYDPETFTPRKGLMTRYAKKMVRPEFYGKIYVNGLETI
jgi:hypothetical protein